VRWHRRGSTTRRLETFTFKAWLSGRDGGAGAGSAGTDAPQRPGILDAARGRQVAVEDDHVVAGAGRALQGGRAVVDHVDGETGVAQALADPVGQRNVILYDQHPHMDIVRLAG
jgi:hypothetical protein